MSDAPIIIIIILTSFAPVSSKIKLSGMLTISRTYRQNK